jgi:ferric-dicitrate binding protein FerR (iron transport regulator)
VVLALGAGYFWFSTSGFSGNKKSPEKLAGNSIQDVPPGGNKAILTLADGSQLVLDSSAAGGLKVQGATKILIQDNGTLAYHADKQMTGNAPVLYNTVTTPNGGQYQIILPDGSRVWLNAASSIRFPTTFTSERTITMTGEAYFEVAKDKTKPFKVNVDDKSEVEVLGTHFNINSYGDDGNIMTTLLEGSVKVGVGNRQFMTSRDGQAIRNNTVILKPGQQAILSQTSQASQIIPVQTYEVIAWKNGLFNLAGADLKDLMHQVERWYDLRVQYEGAVPDMEFQGKLNRAVPLSDIIDYLKNLGVECSLEGKTLHVKSK